jgi:hypothetical protein
MRFLVCPSCYTSIVWTEVGTDLSADPGPEAKSGAPVPPNFLFNSTSFLAQCDKSQGVWGTGPPGPENTAFSPHFLLFLPTDTAEHPLIQDGDERMLKDPQLTTNPEEETSNR